MKHAPLAPSSAQRWTACPGSHAAELAAPPGRPSAAADLGTNLHAHTARCLELGLPAATADLGSSLEAVLEEALEHCRRIIDGRPALLETTLRPLPGLPQMWGTADVLVFDHDIRLQEVIDLKFGVWLVPADSLQLAVYGILAAQQFGPHPDGVRCTVVQPRAQCIAGPVRSAHYTIDQLQATARWVRQAAAATAKPDAPRRAGEWCTFCRAADGCETRRLLSSQRAKSAFFA